MRDSIAYWNRTYLACAPLVELPTKQQPKATGHERTDAPAHNAKRLCTCEPEQ
jgi:hypothetical protein